MATAHPEPRQAAMAAFDRVLAAERRLRDAKDEAKGILLRANVALQQARLDYIAAKERL